MHTFAVSRVGSPDRRFAPITAQASLQRNLGHSFEASATNLDGTLIDFACPNLLLGTAVASFAHHYPLTLSPDDVWLAIAQGFALHINQNVEALRSHFVDPRVKGKTLIRLLRDNFVKGSPDNDWPGCFDEFNEKIRDHVGKPADFVTGGFSTTGPIELSASQVVLMDALQGYFEYRVKTRCGIPEITLLGTPDDWRSIRDRAAALDLYRLEWWTQHLLPVCDELVNASAGKPDIDMWRSFVKKNDRSGGETITGWINTLFPYVNGFGDKRPTERNEFMSKQTWNDDWGGTSTNDFPSGFGAAPFIWEYYGTELPMKFVAGFAGVSQDPTSKSLRPAIGWAVADADVQPVPVRRGR